MFNLKALKGETFKGLAPNFRMRGKLFAALGGIVLLTATAVGIGLYSFRTVEDGFQELSQQRLPSIENAANLALISTRVATAAAAVANSITADQQQQSFDTLRQAVSGIGELEEKFVKTETNQDLVNSVFSESQAFQSALEALDDATKAQIAARTLKHARMLELFNAYEGVNKAITPVVDDAYFTVVLGGEDAAEQSKALVNNLANTEMTKLRYYLELRAEVNLLSGIVETVVFVTDPALLTVFEDKASATQAKINELVQNLDEMGLETGADEPLQQLKEITATVLATATSGETMSDAARRQKLEKGLGLQKAIDNALVTQIDDQIFTLTIDTDTAVEENSAIISDLLNNQVGQLKSTLETQAFANHFVATMVQGGLTDDPNLIIPAQEKITASAEHMRSGFEGIESKEIRQQLEDLLAYGDPETGLLVDHLAELSSTAASEKQVVGMFETVDRIGQSVASLIELELAEVDHSTQQIETQFANGSLALIVVGLVSLVIAAAICWFVVERGLIKPLLNLVQATRTLAAGQLEIDIDSSKRSDEIGELTDAIKVFRENAIERGRLETAAHEEQAAQSERHSHVQELISTFRSEIEGVLGNVGQHMDQMQTTAQVLSQISNETSSQATEAAGKSETASQNVESVAAAAEQLAGSITEIGQQVSKATEIVANASGKAQNTSEKVTELAEAADRIGEVVTLIRAIAEQTNLLALNATIEAARAGEAGKGFAVVAAEVKELATQTSKATEEISTQIEAIQSSTGASVAAIEEIRETMEQADGTTSAIAAAVEEQDASTSMISANVREAAEGTQGVTSSVTSVQDAVAEAVRSADHVEAASNEVAEQTRHLKNVVDDFLSKVAAA